MTKHTILFLAANPLGTDRLALDEEARGSRRSSSAAAAGTSSYRADLATIVGARSDDELAVWIGELCRACLGSDVVGARLAGKSVGAVFGPK